MTPEEAADFLASHQMLQLATVDPDGAPRVAPVFYAALGDDELAFLTGTTTRRARNLARDARVSGVVEEGDSYQNLRAVQLAGHARIVAGDAEAQRIAERLARRLSGGRELPPNIENWIPRGRVVVIIEIARIVSWDHTKL
jgi:PPOX class probable F420-dependent enzyme